jgi:geranylgeranyl pyrophosphate synthase
MVEQFIKEHIASHSLNSLLNYALFPMGKILRTQWMQCVAQECKISLSIPYAACIECIHTYSLIHDDLPSMDHGLLRRGKDSMWVHSGEANAVLIGDLLLSMAFEFIDDLNIMKKVSKAAQDMVVGQYIDMNQTIETCDDIIHLYRLKTGQLFAVSGWIAGYLGHNESTWWDIGEKIGICYQIIDDLNDTKHTTKDRHKDDGKKTLMATMGIKKTKEYLHDTMSSLPPIAQNFLKTLIP